MTIFLEFPLGHSQNNTGLANRTITNQTCFNLFTHKLQSISYRNFITMPPKNRFYELSPQQKESQKINDIYKLINHQQETMAQLLSKYQDNSEKDYSYRSPQSLAYQIGMGNYRGKSQSAKLQTINLELPSINPLRKGNKKKYKKKVQENPYSFDLKSQRDKIALKDHLEKAYGTERLKINRSRTKILTSQKQPNDAKKQQLQRISQSQKDQSDKLYSIKKQNNLPIPLGYLKDNIEQDSSSEQGQVPLTYYQKQYKAMIRQQSLEQTNFLYFSKNQSIKDWTEGLLLLFQKHDKQLQSLRKKCKYLQKFDYNYFSIDIFKET